MELEEVLKQVLQIQWIREIGCWMAIYLPGERYSAEF